MIVNLKEILEEAEKGKYAVGLFNHLNLETSRGIIEAAEEEKSPVILGVAEVHLPSIPFEFASMIMKRLADEASVPVCIHFDHGRDYSKIMKAIACGFSSVMYDGSSLSYEENIYNTKEISKVAHSLGISVEAELGHVGDGADYDNEENGKCFTQPGQVNDFIKRADADALAVAVGTAHGAYKSPPKLDLKLLSEIYKISEKPLVLHGGSGLTDDDFRNSIKNGIRKINICTHLCNSIMDSYAESKKENKPFEEAVICAKNEVKKATAEFMRIFGSSGMA